MKIASFLLICAAISNFSWSASFDCTKARTAIEKKICSTTSLSDLDSKLADIYSDIRNNNSESLNKIIMSKQKKWLNKRNADCKNSKEPCLVNSYTNQINYLTNLNSLIDANKKITSAFKPGTMEFGNAKNIGETGIEANVSLENFKQGHLFSALSLEDKDVVRKKLSTGYSVTTINEDINGDYLVDSIVYQTMGSGSCSRPFLLIRQPNSTLKLAKTPEHWELEGEFCNTSLTVFGIENKKWLGNIDTFRNGGGRLNLYADIGDDFSMTCNTLFGVQTKFETNNAIAYHDELEWVFRNKIAIESAINSKKQSELSVELLSKLAQQDARGHFHLDINGDDTNEEFTLIKNILNVKNKQNKFVPINDFWKLEQRAEKYKHTSYNYLSRYGAQYLFFKGSGNKLYMIYWNNGELGWRQSQVQIMMLYRLGGNKPEHLDSLLLDPINTYVPNGIDCM